MIAVLVAHVVGAGLLFACRGLGRRVFLVAALIPAGTFAWLLAVAGRVTDGQTEVQDVTWVSQLALAFDLRLDGFALLMALLVTGIGVLVLLYSSQYFGQRSGLERFAAILVLFEGSMLGILWADNLFALYVFWELTSVTSYLLIGFEDDKAGARAAALRALLVTGAGGLAMLGGFVVLSQEAGTASLSAILADPPTGTAVSVALALVLLGALTKSAQVPFHFWLPGAMAAPTPVSAYLHSATMVKAGIVLIARLAPTFAGLVVWWRPVVVGIGVATMLLGGYRALRQNDLKLLLAFGTVSQLGFMVALVGSGVEELVLAGVAVILAHALFKAALFLVVGIIDHQTHTRDLRRLDGLGAGWRPTIAAAAVAVGSMLGIAPLMGFLGKEAALDGLVEEPGAWLFALLGVVVGSVLTTAYGARFLWGAFATKRPDDLRGDVVAGPSPAPAATFLAPSLLLGALTIALGLVPALADLLVLPATEALTGIEPKHLALWHGFTPALGLSVVAVTVGLLLFAGRAKVAHLQERLSGSPSLDRGYEGSLRGLNRLADRVTGTLQSGSLPVYLQIILLTVVLAPGSVLLLRTSLPANVRLAESALQLGVALLVMAAAVITTLLHRRFAAVLFLGVVGYGVAALFVIQGAPDLALTQLLVETLVLVTFVLVLRRLPERFEGSQARRRRAVNLTIATSVGVLVTFFALVAAGARTAPSVSGELIERALPEAGGRNVVNVILVDFRAFDTVGEITVLTVAVLGITSLIAAGRRDQGSET